VAVAAAIAPAAMFLAVAGDAYQRVVEEKPKPVAEAPAPHVEIVAAPAAAAQALTVGQPSPNAAPDQPSVASRLRVVDRTLPAGVAPEKGLQVRTIFVARSISALFPEISNIGGVRPDALRWHPNGLALDVMIPDPSSEAGIALGDKIVSYVLANADRFGIQDAIWRGTYYTPDGGRQGGYGHYDHVHVTTTGGGYPTGSEVYYR
jgi:hypothetical protein